MSWTKALESDKLRPGDRKVVQVKDQPVLLIHHQGEVFATEASCPHMGLPLQIGRISADYTLHCPWHHSAFDLRNGDVKEWAPWPPGIGPMLGKLRRERALQVWPTKIEEGHIWVSLDDPATPEASSPDSDAAADDGSSVSPVI